MEQANLFNLEDARAKRDQGLQDVADNNGHFLMVARDIAKRLAAVNGTVTMDDVRRRCPLDPLHPGAYGAVFRGKDWVFTGVYVQSQKVSRRGGMQRVWRLK